MFWPLPNAPSKDHGGPQRVLADQEHDEAGDDEGDQKIEQRDQAVVGPGGSLA